MSTASGAAVFVLQRVHELAHRRQDGAYCGEHAANPLGLAADETVDVVNVGGMGTGGSGHRTRAVVFDLWGTLVPFCPPLWDSALARIASALGARLDEFTKAWADGYTDRITGDLAVSFRRTCEAVGVPVDEAGLRLAVELRSAAHAAMFVPRADAAPTLRQARALGCRVGLLTNCTSEVPQLWRDSPLSSLVDATVFSCAEGLRKPDRAIYALAAARLGVPAGSCVFVGDGGDGELAGASAAGMTPILLQTDDTEPRPGWRGPVIGRLSDLFAHLPG